MSARPPRYCRHSDRAFPQRIDALRQERLTEPPFDRFGDPVLWLDGIQQAQWAETVLAGIHRDPAKPVVRSATP